MTKRRPAIRPTRRGKPAAAATLRLLELRSYAMAGGQRDALNSMFEEHFLDAYEAAGARILGVFHDAQEPDRWVWIRAFPDPATRARALKGFYSSDAWLSLRTLANRTIRSSRDATLLRPLVGDFDGLQAPAKARVRLPGSVLECVRGFLKSGEDQDEVADVVQHDMFPVLEKLGATPLALLVNSEEPNLYPRAPLRSGKAVVWLLRFSSLSAHQRHVATRAASRAWADVEHALSARLRQPLEFITLLPQRRSALR